MTQEFVNQKSLKERWGDYLKSTTLDLRGLLIEAVASHEGWEESAIALVDEAIMPVLDGEGRSEIPVVDETFVIERIWRLFDQFQSPTIGNRSPYAEEMAKRKAKEVYDLLQSYLRTTEPVSRELEVLKNVVRFADGRCWPEVQAAIDANRELLKHVD